MTRMRSKSAIEMALLSAGSLVGSMGETSVVVSSESLQIRYHQICATAIMLFNKQHLLIRIYQVSSFITLIEYIATFLKTKEQKIVDARAIENAI